MEPTSQGRQKVQTAPKILPQSPTSQSIPQSSSFSLKKKIVISLGVLIGGIILTFLILGLIGTTLDKDSDAVKEKQLTNKTIITTTMETKIITLKELFPLISGNIADYDITIPKSYISQHVSINDKDIGTSALANNSLTGTIDDGENILSQMRENNSVDFKIISHGIFRARFTATTGLDEKGDFVDQKSGLIGESFYQKMGMTNVTYKKDTFRGIKSVPIAIITGELQGSHLRMLYLYSPADNLVILFSLQGGNDQTENDSIWNIFTESFTKPL